VEFDSPLDAAGNRSKRVMTGTRLARIRPLV
jgi:hypothetical protein